MMDFLFQSPFTFHVRVAVVFFLQGIVTFGLGHVQKGRYSCLIDGVEVGSNENVDLTNELD
jgi:hypothetical protein